MLKICLYSPNRNQMLTFRTWFDPLSRKMAQFVESSEGDPESWNMSVFLKPGRNSSSSFMSVRINQNIFFFTTVFKFQSNLTENLSCCSVIIQVSGEVHTGRVSASVLFLLVFFLSFGWIFIVLQKTKHVCVCGFQSFWICCNVTLFVDFRGNVWFLL